MPYYIHESGIGLKYDALIATINDDLGNALTRTK